MFVLSRDVSAAKRVIATLLATAIVLWASGAMSIAQAANLTDVRDLITDSAPAALADHQIEFTHPADGAGVPNGEDIVITFPATFSLAGIGTEDVSLFVDGADFGQANWTLATSATDVTITIGTGSISAGSSSVVYIGTNASNDGDTPDSQIQNPTTPAGGNESFEIDISAGTVAPDTGHTRVVILNTVLVTATVDTVFDFTVWANATGTAVNGTATTTYTSATTAIPFGTLDAYTPVTLSQDLTVKTNAINGFVVTVEADGDLRSSTGADIDVFKDATAVTTPEPWESPLAGLNVNDENTWGHWGVTSEDATTTRSNEFGVDDWAGLSSSTVIVFSHDGPADEVTPGIGSTTVGYRVEISPLQEAADDYQTTLTYIATPTF